MADGFDESFDAPGAGFDEHFDAPDQAQSAIENTVNSTPLPNVEELINKFKEAPDLAAKAGAELINPNDPWFNKYKNQGLSLELASPETREQIESYKAPERALGELFSAPKKLAVGALNTIDSAVFQPLRGATAGLAARLNEVQENPGDNFNKSLDRFLNPEILKEKRQEYSEYLNSDTPLLGSLQKLRFELAPPIEFNDILSESDKMDRDTVLAGLEPLVGKSGTRFIGDVATMLATDPAMYMSFGARAPKGKALKVGGLSEEIAAKERAVLTGKIPGQQPFAVYEGAKEAQVYDEVKSALQAKLGVKMGLRNLSQKLGFPMADDTIVASNISKAENTREAKGFMEWNKALGGNDPKVARVAQLIREHGREEGQLLAVKMGIGPTEEQLSKADTLNQFYGEINAKGNQILKDAGISDLSKASFGPPSEDYKQAYEEYLKATKGIDVPRILVQDEAGLTHDLTYSKQYDYGRALKEEIVDARKIDDQLRINQDVAKNLGVQANISSAKPRSRLSTVAMESIMAQKGVGGGAFNPNYGDVIVSKYLEKADAARATKFVESMADNYGVMPGRELEAIQAAGRRVDMKRLAGLEPSMDDLIVSKLDPSDFVAPQSKSFEKLRYFNKAPDAVMLKGEKLVFPKNIALKLDQMLLGPQVSRNKLLQTAAWWQRQWAGNVLTNGLRLGKQVTDNLGRIAAIEATPQALMQLNPLRKADYIDEIMETLPSISSESAWSLKDFDGPIKVSTKMLNDPDTNNIYYAYINSLKENALKGEKQFLDIQGIGPAAGRAAKGAAEFANENKISRTLREVGNSADIVTRKAAFRKYINDGYSVKDAVKMVNEHLMDFENSTDFTRALRYVSPFASFNLKNIESLPKLLALNPALLKTFNPDNGYLTKAWMDASGWNVDDYKLANKMLPFYRSQYIGPVLHGSKELIENAPYIQKKFEDYFYAGMSDKQKEKAKGMLVSFDVPNFVQAGIDFADPTSVLSSPLAQSLLYAAGINPFTGERHTEDPRENIRQAFASVNPYQYPKVYNKLVLPLIDAIRPKMAESLRQGPFSADIESIFKLNFGKDALKRAKLDENTIRELTNEKFMGLARADAHDMNYYYQQIGLINSLDKLVSDNGGMGSLVQKAIKGDREDVKRALARIYNIADDLKFNTKVYKDFRKRFDEVRTQMSPDELEALDKMISSDDAAQEQVPVEASPNEGSEHELPEEDAFLSKQGSRAPAGEFVNGPNEPVNRMWDSRAHEIINEHNLDLFKPREREFLDDMLRNEIKYQSPGVGESWGKKAFDRRTSSINAHELGGPGEESNLPGPGMAASLGVAALMAGGAQNTESQSISFNDKIKNDRIRKYQRLSDYSLESQPDSQEKSDELEYRKSHTLLKREHNGLERHDIYLNGSEIETRGGLRMGTLDKPSTDETELFILMKNEIPDLEYKIKFKEPKFGGVLGEGTYSNINDIFHKETELIDKHNISKIKLEWEAKLKEVKK